MTVRALAFALLFGLAACAEPAAPQATGLLLRIDAEAGTKAQLSSVRVVLHRDTGMGWETRGDDVIPKERITAWPIEIPVRKLDGADPSLELQVYALDADSHALNVARLVTRYVPNAIGVVPVLLRDGCLGERCETLESCHGPACRACRIDACEASGEWQPVSYTPGEALSAQLDRFEPVPDERDAGQVDGSAASDAGDASSVVPPAPCVADQRVVSGACAACPDGTTSEAGADPSGTDTTCDPILCVDDQRVVSHACVACEGGETNRAGDDASGSDTLCDGNLCAVNQHVTGGTCEPCEEGTARAAGDDPLGEDTSCEARECLVDQRVLDHSCEPCPPGTNAPAGASATGADTTCTPRLCELDEQVIEHDCVACPSGGPGNRAGDDASGADTTCDGGALCASDQRVEQGECVACEPGTTNAAGDNALGADTSCEPTFCSANHRVVGHACLSCPAGSTNAAGDDASGDDTSCDPILCGEDLRVSDHGCVACPGFATNAAGDDASGDDTSCDTCCPDANCLCHGTPPAELTSDDGPYTSAMYEIAGVGCVFYPTDAGPSLAAIVMAEGFTGEGGCMGIQISRWPPLYASWGMIAMVVNTGANDQPAIRADRLEDGLYALAAENIDSESPLFGKIAGRYATSGFSMGGGASTIMSARDGTLRASVALMPFSPVTEGIDVPTLIVCGSSDNTAACASHGRPCYDGIASSVSKLITTISSGHNGQPEAGGGASGEYGLAFMKLFLEGDQRWRPLLLAAPNDGTTIE